MTTEDAAGSSVGNENLQNTIPDATDGKLAAKCRAGRGSQ